MVGKKLLVADDSLTIQKVIRLALSNEGYEIQAVSDGNDAIQQISLFRPDAVLIDVSLPSKSAFEVKRAINEHADLEEVRFILMSSAFEKVDEAQAEEVRFHGRLTKPFDPAHLRQVLADALAQVEARRREPTSLLQRPVSSEASAPATPPPSHSEPSFAVTPPAPLASPSDPGGPMVGDDWLKPVEPQEPIIAPPPLEGIHQLWDNEPTLAAELMPPPPQVPAQTPPPPASPASIDSAPHGTEPDADIRHLTESTIRMSGLDDYDWSVNEPSLKPPSQLLDTGGTSFRIDGKPGELPGVPPFKPEQKSEFVPEIANVAEASNAPEVESPSLASIPTPSSVVQSAASPSDFYRDPADVTKRLTRPAPFMPPPAPPMQAPPPPMRTAPPFAGAEANVVGISPDQIEELLRKELQKVLPDIAERIIKQEIHRMLSEPST